MGVRPDFGSMVNEVYRKGSADKRKADGVYAVQPYEAIIVLTLKL